MPRVSLEHKRKILGHTSEESPPGWIFDASMGVPLFWGERKSTKFWTQILTDFDAGAVFDLTPGTGTLARACLDAGIQYAGAALNQEHRQWLDTLLDRQALKSAGTTGSAIFSDDLALQVKTHFGDVVDFLNGQDSVPDDDPEEE